MTTKAQFFRKPSIARLPKSEKVRRWNQHVASQKGKSRPGNSAVLAKTSKPRSQPALIRNKLDSIVAHGRGVIPVTSATSLTIVSAILSPVYETVAGRASRAASMFENYTVSNVRLRYVPTCAATRAGRVAIRFDPDPVDTATHNFSDFVTSGYAKFGAVWDGFTLALPNSAVQKMRRLYVDNPGEINTADPSFRMSAAGLIHILTDGDSAATDIGYLEVEADYHFQTYSERGVSGSVSIESNSPASSATAWWSAVRAYYEGASGLYHAAVNATATNGHIGLNQAGRYLISAVAEGTGITGWDTFSNFLPDGSSGASWQGLTVVDSGGATNSAQTQSSGLWVVDVANNLATIASNSAVLEYAIDFIPKLAAITTLTRMRVNVAKVNPSFTL